MQINLLGPNSSAVTITWYSIDSIGAIRNIVAKNYPIPAYQLPPFSIATAFVTNSGGVIYSTTHTSGNVTVTNNTGPGGVISGTFSFDAINTADASDSVVITGGTFTNLAIPSN